MPAANHKTKETSSAAPAKAAARRPCVTELVWEGKYEDEARTKRRAALRVALPFQTVETVNESAADRRKTLELFAQNRETEWRNRLIWGDKKYVLPSLLAEFAGKVNLAYIDPPFDTGADFSFTATVPDHPDTPEDDSFTFTKEPSIIEHKAYRDTWGRGLDSYLQWFYETAGLLHELLHENGSLYVHLDWHVAHYAKVILDEIFGMESFRNEIVWKRTSAHGNVSQRYGMVHDVIFFYSKSDRFAWSQQFTPYDKEYLDTFFDQTDERGKRYSRRDLTASMERASKGQIYEWKGIRPPGSRCWAMTEDKMDELEAKGRIHWPKKAGGMPRLKLYPEDLPGVPAQDIWLDFSQMHNLSSERLGYPTQKPEALLERILKASSNEGDLVLDCFGGSGTTAAVAEKLKRRWITCDLGRFAIHTARKRLLAIPGVRPFVVQNLGKYERQLWQAQTFQEAANHPEAAEQAAARQRDYVRFILQQHHATPLSGHVWLHGIKGGRMVHVGSVDAPVTVGDVTHIAAEFKRAVGTGKDAPKCNGVDLLGWDFAFEMNEVARQQAAAANIQMRFLRIPRDVMDKRAVEQGEIRFFELAALAVETKVQKREVALKLTDFIIPPDDVPAEVQASVKHWSQWIDYWAVDWNNAGDTFHNEWQTYRTRKEPKLALETTHTYPEPGDYRVVVKVIDILGNDTTKTVKVKVK